MGCSWLSKFISNVEKRLYIERQGYLKQISAVGDEPNRVAEIDQYVQQIEKINAILTRLAKHKLARHWPTELEMRATIES
jgi:hypothetical protein